MTPITGGVWPAMLTPFEEDGRPSLQNVDRLVDLFVDQGMDGLYVLGSTGQGPALSLQERREVAQRAVARAAGRIPIMIHVGCIATSDAVALARHAGDIGADGVSSVPPIYFPADADAEFEHYARIGSASDLPFYPYVNTMLFGEATISAQEYAQRMMDLPNIQGTKFTDRNLFRLGLVCQYAKGLKVFSGADELICPAAACGAVGAIGSFYNVWGPAVQRVRQSFVEGDFELGRHFMGVFQQTLDQILQSGAVYGFIRSAMRLKYGIDIGPGRTASALKKVRPWDDDQVRQALDQVDQAAGQEAGIAP